MAGVADHDSGWDGPVANSAWDRTMACDVVILGGARRSGSGGHRGTLVVVGLIDILLAVLLLLSFPFAAMQALGLFVGPSLVPGGLATMFAAWLPRRVTT